MLPSIQIYLIVLCTSCLGIQASALIFSGDPPDDSHPWAVHDDNRPQPPVVEAGEKPGDAPSDARVLFDGSESSLANWAHLISDSDRESDWSVVDGALVCAPGAGDLKSIQEFGDCQLHLEWSAPETIIGEGQWRGNSGVFLMGMVEVQILDNYQNPTYPDGTAGAIYGVMPPSVNALRPPGKWQSYDIIFRRPIIREDTVLDPGSITVLCNGVVIQDIQSLEGGGGHLKRPPNNRFFPEKGSLLLQDHGNPVRFRNIWYRPLRPRAIDGGIDGGLDPELTLIKRASIAQDIRIDAVQKVGIDRALRLYESLIYSPDGTALLEANQLMAAYLKKLEEGTLSTLDEEKSTVLRLHQAFTYMDTFDLLYSGHFALPILDKIIKVQGWDK